MFKINEKSWRVLLVPPTHPKLQKDNYEYALGVCDNNDSTIYINDNLSPSKFKKVLCHEMTHAAMFSYNIYLSYEQEEIVADILATYGQEIIDITNELFSRIIKNRRTF